MLSFFFAKHVFQFIMSFKKITTLIVHQVGLISDIFNRVWSGRIRIPPKKHDKVAPLRKEIALFLHSSIRMGASLK